MEHNYCVCGKQINRKSKNCCECAHKISSKIEWPSKNYFEKILWEKPVIEIAKELGVSDVAVCKKIKTMGLSKPENGYWLKKRASKEF